MLYAQVRFLSPFALHFAKSLSITLICPQNKQGYGFHTKYGHATQYAFNLVKWLLIRGLGHIDKILGSICVDLGYMFIIAVVHQTQKYN